METKLKVARVVTKWAGDGVTDISLLCFLSINSSSQELRAKEA